MFCISWVTGLRPRRVTLLLAAALEEAAEELRRTWLELEVLLEGVVALERVAAEELRVAALPLVALERVCVLFCVALLRVALPLVALERVAELLFCVALERVWVLLFCVALLRVAEPLLTVPELRVALLEELFVVVPRRTGF